MAHLENWAMLEIRGPYQAIEQAYSILCGDVTGHPKLRNGYIETSSIVRAEGDEVITKSGTRYTLGKPAPDYETKFPNARERLLRGATL